MILKTQIFTNSLYHENPLWTANTVSPDLISGTQSETPTAAYPRKKPAETFAKRKSSSNKSTCESPLNIQNLFTIFTNVLVVK